MAKLIPRYLNQECYQVIEADLEGTKELLKNKFDYIFATGSTQMGRSVMAAAAPHLTPVTLELGGKSPVYIDNSSDFTMAAKRILWGKCMNLGQTCIAPDYVLCSKAVEKEFVKVATEVLGEWYGKTWKNSPDLPRIVNDRNFLRLQKMLSTTKGRVAFGGETDAKERWISPTLLVDIDISDSVMEEEIFGPILPILTVDSPDAAIRLINSRPKPLALYVFSKQNDVVQKFMTRTSSGGVCINDVIWHNGLEGLPFGGVGESGMGNYHGKYSFETFTHKKGVLARTFSAMGEKLGSARYPPYDKNKIRFFTFVLRYMQSFNLTYGRIVTHGAAILLGAFLVVAYLNYF
jgi:acyl-CoA reductase-like NAD-dependent aldehyde dehydrogenase